MIKIETKMTGNFKTHKKVIKEKLYDTMDLAVQMGEEEAVHQAKKAGLVGTTRHLVEGIYGTVISEVYGRIGVQTDVAIYGEVMEKGRRAGSKMPPPEALERWVYLKLRVARKKVKSTAFVIARSIKRKGIKGRHFFQKAEKAVKPKIQRLYEITIKQIENFLSDK